VTATAPAAAASPPPLAGWQAFALTLAVYALLARLGLSIAIQPGNASPLFPAAGFALAAALVWGRPVLWAIPLAATVANLVVVAGPAPLTVGLVAVWLATGVGAALQAALGAWCLRRFVSQPLVLSEPSDLARFMLLLAPLVCCVSASIALAVLLGSGTIGTGDAAVTWGAWWVGDTLGVVIGAPVALAFIGRPRNDWAPRRWSVALPLVAVALIIGVGVREAQRADAELARQTFQREADNATSSLLIALQEPQRALEALRGVADVAPTLDRDGFRRSVSPWLIGADGLLALGYGERVARVDIAAFEARERAAGRPDFRVLDRRNAGIPQPDEDFVVAVRFIEPRAPNLRALGVNSRSVARARAAIDRAARTGRPAVTEAFELTQGGTGVVLYQALYSGEPQTVDERTRSLRAVVFATLRPSDLLSASARRINARLGMCLLDNEAVPAQRLLAGDGACLALGPEQPLHVHSIAFGGRQWDLRVFETSVQRDGVGRAWPFALIGLACTSLLGALLLTITGRARRIAAAVDERTTELQQRSAELQAEVVQRQRTASALRDSQQRLRNILDHAPIGVAYTDSEGRIREANPKLREMLGHPLENLNGQPIARLLHPEDRNAEAQARARLLDGEVPMAHWHLRCLTADGRTLWTRASVSVLRAATGEPRRMVWVMEDITEHLALEEAQRARKGAEAANLAKSEFLSRMSHELRTPLNAMLGFTQLLELDRRQPLAPHQLDWTAQMRQAGWHLLHMINDTLDLSRIESGHIELAPETLDLAAVMGEACALVEGTAAKRRVRIEVHLGEGARAALGDPTRVKQILTNLLSNAIKYNQVEGRVVVTSRLAEEGRVALEVIDTGEGMSPEQLAQLFQPFNRLGREGGPIEGTGIGLVISRRLADLMGGRLYARSTPGMGSTFTLELPRATERPARERHDHDDDLPLPAYRRRLVHYVEDNETNVEVMRGILALRPQVQLDVSMLGADGLAAIRARRPSLVLLDMQLPDMDGLDVLRALQADEDTSEIPVIVVSADATEARVSQAIAAGASHYVTKPVNVSELLRAMDGVLEELDTHFG
jgi:PAS domain S-box-containing protein